MRILIKLLAFMVLFLSAYILYDRHDMRRPVVFEALERINPIPKTKEFIQNKNWQKQRNISHFSCNLII